MVTMIRLFWSNQHYPELIDWFNTRVFSTQQKSMWLYEVQWKSHSRLPIVFIVFVHPWLLYSTKKQNNKKYYLYNFTSFLLTPVKHILTASERWEKKFTMRACPLPFKKLKSSGLDKLDILKIQIKIICNQKFEHFKQTRFKKFSVIEQMHIVGRF